METSGVNAPLLRVPFGTIEQLKPCADEIQKNTDPSTALGMKTESKSAANSDHRQPLMLSISRS
jgi:hypothetical protein